MIKILHIRRNTSGGFDGTDNYCRDLYRLFEHDEDCRVLPIHDIEQTRSVFNYSYRDEVLREQIAQADVIHINGYTAMGTIRALRIAKQMGKRVVYTAHWHPFRCLRRPMLGWMFFHLLMRPTIQKYADVVTTINNEDTAFFRRFCKHVVRIPHTCRTPMAEETKKQKGNILFVGRINDQVKGFEHLMAIPEGRYTIHCVGRGTLPVERKDMIQHTDIPYSELSQLYDQAELVVIPSKYEAFSYVALEALMHHTPILMSDRVRIADYLEGVSGYKVFHYGDKETFIDAIESTIGMQVETEKIYNQFSEETVRQKYKEIYMTN